MIELEHSPLGGSGADRWMNCPGSFLMHRALAETGELESNESGFARLGTAAHELGALCLTEEREPYEFIGREIGGYVVGEGGIDPNAVAIYVNECESLWPRDGKGTVLIETTLAFPEIQPHLRGTVDFGYWSPKRGMHLRDYKNGEGVGVYATGNRQMLYYAFLMALSHPWLKEGPRDLRVTLGIVQPNFHGLFAESDVWETTLGYVLDFGHCELLPTMRRLTATKDVDASDFVSGSHCQFCPVLLDCPTMQKAFKEYAEGTEFVEMLTNAELDRYYAMRDDARRFTTALDQTIYARSLAGATFTSAKLVEKLTRRTWKPGAQAVLAATFGDNAFTDRELKSPAQIEKLSSRGKELALEYGFKPDASQLTIAPISDHRPAAKPVGGADVFAGYEGF